MNYEKLTLVALRVSMGWLFFYAGITKVIDPAWTAEGYIKGAKNFTWFFQWLLSPELLPVVNFMNEWGLTLLGASLILGVGVRLSSVLGAILMLMYYIVLPFPYPNAHSLVVDEHIIYAVALLFLASIRAGRVWGLEDWCSNLPVCAKYPKLREWLG